METVPLGIRTETPAAGPVSATQEGHQTQEHAGRLRTNALNLAGSVVIALGSAGPTASIALTLAGLVAVTSYASPLAILICTIPCWVLPWRTGA